MRRENFIDAVANVKNAIVECKVSETYRRMGEKVSVSEVFTFYSDLKVAYEKFGPAEKSVFAALKLSPLLRAETWKIEETSHKRDPEYFGVRYELSTLLEGIAADLADLLKRDGKSGSLIIEDTKEVTAHPCG